MQFNHYKNFQNIHKITNQPNNNLPSNQSLQNITLRFVMILSGSSEFCAQNVIIKIAR